MNWLDSIAETSGHPTAGFLVFDIDEFVSLGTNMSKINPVYERGAKLVKGKKRDYCLAIGTMQHRMGPWAIGHLRNMCNSGDFIGFDTGAAIHAGQVKSKPPSNLTDSSALVGFFLAHGLPGNPNKIEILKLAVRQPEYRIGVSVAVRSMNESRKGTFERAIESLLMI